MLIALVQNNLVVGLYQPSDDLEHQAVAKLFEAAVDVTDMHPTPQIGWIFNGNQLLQSDGSQPIDWRISKFAFRSRFTMAEMTGIFTAAQSNMTVQVLMQNQALVNFVDLSRSDTQAGVMALVAFGLITSARATAILTTPPAAIELQFPSGGN
jgi:hypothetical protein